METTAAASNGEPGRVVTMMLPHNMNTARSANGSPHLTSLHPRNSDTSAKHRPKIAMPETNSTTHAPAIEKM
ncbi:hypothetical protein B5P44_26250 [Mycobacterium sp. CBMA 213]|nr:hypothetical protein [Mycolicibacterium sp. CBMA 213]